MKSCSIVRRCATFLGLILAAHVVASYVSQLCFGAYAWRQGFLHEENWINSFAATPLHWFQDWIVPLTIWFGEHITEPSTFRLLDVISVASYFGAFCVILSIWYWRDRMKRLVRRGLSVRLSKPERKLPDDVTLGRTAAA